MLTVRLYAPIMASARQSLEIFEGLNDVADTLLFGGTVLLLAGALRDETR